MFSWFSLGSTWFSINHVIGSTQWIPRRLNPLSRIEIFQAYTFHRTHPACRAAKESVSRSSVLFVFGLPNDTK